MSDSPQSELRLKMKDSNDRFGKTLLLKCGPLRTQLIALFQKWVGAHYKNAAQAVGITTFAGVAAEGSTPPAPLRWPRRATLAVRKKEGC